MEETWKDISLSPLRHSTTAAAMASSATENPFTGLDLLDLFSLPSHKYTPRNYDPHGPSSATRSHGGAAVSGCSSTPVTTVLSMMNSGFSDQIHTSSPPLVSSMDFSVLPCSLPLPSKRKVLDHDDAGGGERFKRLMKCRESGDRCRGRKQTYIEELEKEQRQLKKENAKIRRDLQKDGTIVSRKQCRVRRSSTAPL